MHISVTPADDLQAVFDWVPEGTTIHMAPGIYRQKTVLQTGGVTLQGSGPEKTVLVWDDYAKKRDFLGMLYNTFRTYTLAVCADGVTMKDLAVVNDALQPEIKGQEVALSVVGSGFRMENCRLRSTQDTLFLGPLPPDLIRRYDGFLLVPLQRGTPMDQRFRNCLIEGTVDFIFGCGDALFEDCEIRSLEDVRKTGYIAAPAHGLSSVHGFRFRNCRLTCEAGVDPGSVYLARPWRDYGLVSFEGCRCGPHIRPEGFHHWSGTNRDQTARFYEIPPVSGRVSWINRDPGKQVSL